jgi:hypothetical protein
MRDLSRSDKAANLLHAMQEARALCGQFNYASFGWASRVVLDPGGRCGGPPGSRTGSFIEIEPLALASSERDTLLQKV